MDDSLYHYGVKGMKWGVRRKNYKNVKDLAKYRYGSPPKNGDYTKADRAHKSLESIARKTGRSYLNTLNNPSKKADDDYENSIDREVSNLLGRYGKRKVNMYFSNSSGKDRVEKVLASTVARELIKDMHSSTDEYWRD